MKGFTLIELLVVVLIIGILSAVALPQYQMAVAKSKVSRGVVLLNAVDKAQKEYYLANGYFTEDLESLSIDVKGLGACYSAGSWGFCQVVAPFGATLEWNWQAGRETHHRCFSNRNNQKGSKLCSMYGDADCGIGDDRFCRLMRF